MCDDFTILLARIEVDITSDHLSFPVLYKVIINTYPRITDLSHKNIKHRQSMFIRYRIVFIISHARWYDDDLLWISIVEDRLHYARMSDVWWIECSPENIDHTDDIIDFAREDKKNPRYFTEIIIGLFTGTSIFHSISLSEPMHSSILEELIFDLDELLGVDRFTIFFSI
jgi:hypothetical protein